MEPECFAALPMQEKWIELARLANTMAGIEDCLDVTDPLTALYTALYSMSGLSGVSQVSQSQQTPQQAPQNDGLISLKDGSKAMDPRLDRLVLFDERSRNFPVMRMLGEDAEKKPRSYTWSIDRVLDQGQEGACVGFSFSHELLAKPVVVQGVDAKFAREKVYWEAQKIDPWSGGAYPGARPFYEGTAVLAGVKVLQKMGHYASYHWCFSLEELIMAVGYGGPVVLGINWYTGMFSPDVTGRIKVSGRVAGGHSILTNGVNVKREEFKLPNSWGDRWAIKGTCTISFSDMERLLKEQGEACCVKRVKIPA